MKKLKILELTNFSAGGCGVFARVKREAVLLKKAGFDVQIFSSNIEKGTGKIVASADNFEGVPVKRFSALKLGGESFMNWNFKKSALEYSPDIIIAHVYRHIHTLTSLKVAKKINAKVFLVTHAPFNRDKSRGFIARQIVRYFDSFLGKRVINSYDKIISITKWELPYLESLGVDKSKIVYIPNGIPAEFFKKQKAKEGEKILFMGRISPVKGLATLIKAMVFLKNKTVKLEIYGPAEKSYLSELNELIRKLKLQNRVLVVDKIYDTNTEIRKLDSGKIFVLPSISEGMPQVLIEALARKKIVIASSNPGNSDIIQDKQNGFIFEVGNSRELAEKINLALALSNKEQAKIKASALKTANKFKWESLIKNLINVIHKA